MHLYFTLPLLEVVGNLCLMLVCFLSMSHTHKNYILILILVRNTRNAGGFLSNQEAQEAKISSYEEALAKIKDATGVSNIQEVVDRFLNQGNTKKHLEQLKEENSLQLARLKEEKEKLQAQFEDMKYSGEAKMST